MLPRAPRPGPPPASLLHPPSLLVFRPFPRGSDPQEGGQDLCHHALVSGAVLPEDASGASEIQPRHAYQLPGARVWVQEVCRGVEHGEAQGARRNDGVGNIQSRPGGSRSQAPWGRGRGAGG